MRNVFVAAVSMSLLLAAAAVAAQAASPAKLEAQATVSMTNARAIALKAYPGKIVKEELEQEKGGSGLRYSFDIKSAKATHEIGVDAKTGKLLENSVEGADND
ncbi:MAG: PepSY domain-containing protein [Rhodanobacter sp.]